MTGRNCSLSFLTHLPFPRPVLYADANHASQKSTEDVPRGTSGDDPPPETNAAGNSSDGGGSARGRPSRDAAEEPGTTILASSEKAGSVSEEPSGGDNRNVEETESSALVRPVSSDLARHTAGGSMDSTASATDMDTKMASSAVASAPSLPPFLKSAPTGVVGAAPAVVQTPLAADETTNAEVDPAQIDGVGFAGTPVQAKTGCKCSIM